MTCIQCDSSCLTCAGSTTSCTSCRGGTYLHAGACLTSCPGGLTADPVSNTCSASALGSIVYFPCSITFLLWAIVLVYSKCNHPNTQLVTSAAAGLALILWCSWLVLVFSTATADRTLDASQRNTVVGVGLAGILCSLMLGIAFNVWFRRTLALDSGFEHWKDRSQYNLYSYRVVAVVTGLTMPFFRMVYGRFFSRNNFSCFFLEGEELLLGSNWFSLAFILFSLLPLIFCCGFLIFLKQSYDQTLIYSIDTLLLSLALLLLLIIDIASKGDDFFEDMLEEQPYLKRLKYNHLEQPSCLRFLD
jgi:hypothetical protein